MYEEAVAEFKKAKQIEDTPLQLGEVGNGYAAAGVNTKLEPPAS